MTQDIKPLSQVAKELKIEHFRLRNWIRFGLHGKTLQHVRKGARLYLRKDVVKKYIKRHLAKV